MIWPLPAGSRAVIATGEVAMAYTRAAMDMPFNLVISRGDIAVIRRPTEEPAGWGTKWGGLEMAGCIVTVAEGRYATVTYDEALAGRGIAPAAQKGFEWSALRALVQWKRSTGASGSLRLEPSSSDDRTRSSSRGEVA